MSKRKAKYGISEKFRVIYCARMLSVSLECQVRSMGWILSPLHPSSGPIYQYQTVSLTVISNVVYDLF
jgi:hypothetical protein